MFAPNTTNGCASSLFSYNALLYESGGDRCDPPFLIEERRLTPPLGSSVYASIDICKEVTTGPARGQRLRRVPRIDPLRDAMTSTVVLWRPPPAGRQRAARLRRPAARPAPRDRRHRPALPARRARLEPERRGPRAHARDRHQRRADRRVLHRHRPPRCRDARRGRRRARALRPRHGRRCSAARGRDRATWPSTAPTRFYDSVALRQRCCTIRKVEPLERALAGRDAWITGQRRAHGPERARLAAHEFDAARGIAKFNPLAAWPDAAVWHYARQFALPVNALYARGYASIGCAPCSRAIRAGEDPRAGRWWWEDAASKECGLHVHAPDQATATTTLARIVSTE